MHGKRALLLVITLGLLLAACQPSTPDTTPLPTANTVTIQITPALRWLRPLLNDCARRNSQGIALDERPAGQLAPEQAVLTLRLGAPDALPAFAAQIAEQHLALVVHPSNPLAELTPQQLADVYTGEITTWEQLAPDAQTPRGEIHNWGYLPGDDLQAAIDALILGEAARASAYYQAPDPEATRQALSGDAAALAFLPAGALDASVKEVRITGLEADTLTAPVLALAAAEPEGTLRTFLVCVQKGIP